MSVRMCSLGLLQNLTHEKAEEGTGPKTESTANRNALEKVLGLHPGLLSSF